MAQLKVHGSVYSTATMRVVACLHEKQLPYQFVSIDMEAGEHKKEPFISLNPFGQVPALEDGDLKLFESRAITQYVAYEYASSGSQLVYLESKKMAIMGLWMEVEAHHFAPATDNLAWELAYKPLMGQVADATVVEENEGKLAKVLDVYETRLAQSKYLGGDTFGLVDLHHLPNIHYLMETQTKKLFEARPHVRAWCTDILARPAWSKTVAMQKQD